MNTEDWYPVIEFGTGEIRLFYTDKARDKFLRSPEGENYDAYLRRIDVRYEPSFG